MTEQDRGSFAELILAIGETYGEPVSDARLEIFFRALSDLSLENIRAAANIHIRTSKFFPRPSEIREGIEGNLDDRAELAWAHVLREVRRVGYNGSPSWPDAATKRAAMELYGGWIRLCSNLPAYGPELLGYAKQFKATFKSYAAQEMRQLHVGAGSGVLTDGR